MDTLFKVLAAVAFVLGIGYGCKQITTSFIAVNDSVNQSSQVAAQNAVAFGEAEKLGAEANLLETQAQVLPTVVYGETEKNLAEACALRNDCGLQSYLQGEEQGEKNAGSRLLWMVIGIAVTVVVAFTVVFR